MQPDLAQIEGRDREEGDKRFGELTSRGAEAVEQGGRGVAVTACRVTSRWPAALALRARLARAGYARLAPSSSARPPRTPGAGPLRSPAAVLARSPAAGLGFGWVRMCQRDSVRVTERSWLKLDG